MTTWDQALPALEKLTQYVKEAEKPRLALDLETFFTDGQIREKEIPRPIVVRGIMEGSIRTIQFGLPPEVEDMQYVFDVRALEETIEDRRRLGTLLEPLLTIPKIFGQNLMYEFMFIWGVYKIRIPAKNLRDTRIINSVRHAGNKAMRSDLATLYDEYIEPHFFKSYTGMFQHEYEELKKRMQKSNWKSETLTREQICYAADDVSRLIFELYDRMLESKESSDPKYVDKSVDHFIETYETRNRHDQSVLEAIKLEWKIIPIFAMAEYRGMQYDIKYHNTEIIPYLQGVMDENEKIVESYFTKEIPKSNGKRGKARVVWTERECININSYHQALPALASIGINLPNYQEETLQEALEEHDHPALTAMVAYKKASSMLSKYGNTLPEYVRANGRIHPNWNQMGGDQAVATGRSTSTNPAIMTIPNDDDVSGRAISSLFRQAFIARAGSILINADFSQVEPRVMAALCNDELMKDAYNKPGPDGKEVDRHALTAQHMFQLPELPVGKDEKSIAYRKAGKTHNLGDAYGMGLKKGAYKISRATKGVINLTIEEYKEKRDALNGAFVGIKRTKEELTRALKKGPEAHGTLRPYLGGKPIAVVFTELGRPRSWFLNQLISKEELDNARNHPEILSKDYQPEGKEKWQNIFNSVMSKISREAFNFKFGQGTAADLFKLALVKVQEALDAKGYDFDSEGIILVMHDEIMLEVKKEHEEEAKELLTEAMLSAAYEMISGIKFVVACASGDSWATCH